MLISLILIVFFFTNNICLVWPALSAYEWIAPCIESAVLTAVRLVMHVRLLCGQRQPLSNQVISKCVKNVTNNFIHVLCRHWPVTKTIIAVQDFFCLLTVLLNQQVCCRLFRLPHTLSHVLSVFAVWYCSLETGAFTENFTVTVRAVSFTRTSLCCQCLRLIEKYRRYLKMHPTAAASRWNAVNGILIFLR